MLEYKWHDQFLNVMEQCIPRKLLPRRKNLPWINRCLIMAIRRRNSLFKKYKVTGLESVLVEYKFVRNSVTSELHRAKQRFFNRLHHSDPKTFWKLYKTLTRKETTIPTLKRPTPSGMAVGSSKKANLLNAQFLKNFNSDNVSSFTSKELSNFNFESSNMPDDLLCSEEEILVYLRDLDVKKSSGADGISAVMLKHTAFVIAPSLKRLFNLSITSGKFPSDWKFARVVPIHKAGARDNPANYRPIPLLSIISNILERHVLNVTCFSKCDFPFVYLSMGL